VAAAVAVVDAAAAAVTTDTKNSGIS